MLWMRTIASLRPFPMSAGNFVGNTIEKAAVLPISIPPRKKYLVYSLFTWGEGGPAKPGRMRGRPCTQPFLVEAEKGARMSPQRNFSPAPLGKSIAPSSVTFGDSFPPRGSLWVVQPYPKKRPKSGHVHGHRNSPTTAPLRPTTPKRASGNERAIKEGGPGGLPPALFLPISREKWGPPPGRRGNGALRPKGSFGATLL